MSLKPGEDAINDNHTKTCPRCGQSNSDWATECGRCGAVLDSTQTPNKPKQDMSVADAEKLFATALFLTLGRSVAQDVFVRYLELKEDKTCS